MRRLVTFLSVAAMAAAPVVFGIAEPASAHSAARFGAARVAAPPALPNSDVTGKAAKLKYNPAKLKAHWGSAVQKPCKPKVASFTITNTTTKAVQVTLQGSAFGDPVPAGAGLIVCASGTGKATGVFGLDGSVGTLTVKIS
jgi:hypothetical protein